MATFQRYAYTSRAAAKGLQTAKATLADMEKQLSKEQRQKGFKLAMQMGASKSQWPAAPLKPVAAAAAAPAPAKPTAIAAQAAAQAPAPRQEKVAKPATPPAIASNVAVGNWRIQLGAFSQRSNAEALYASVARRLPGRQAYYIPVKPIVRLQVGPYGNRAAASAECARLAPQPCFPVAAR